MSIRIVPILETIQNDHREMDDTKKKKAVTSDLPTTFRNTGHIQNEAANT